MGESCTKEGQRAGGDGGGCKGWGGGGGGDVGLGTGGTGVGTGIRVGASGPGAWAGADGEHVTSTSPRKQWPQWRTLGWSGVTPGVCSQMGSGSVACSFNWNGCMIKPCETSGPVVSVRWQGGSHSLPSQTLCHHTTSGLRSLPIHPTPAGPTTCPASCPRPPPTRPPAWGPWWSAWRAACCCSSCDTPRCCGRSARRASCW